MTIQAIDSYDKLFLKNENTGSPTTFLDSSTANPKTITANGNAKQLPIKFNKSAGFFNGTSDYVVVPDHADFDLGTGEYTIEAFVNFHKLTGGNNHAIISIGEGIGPGSGITITYDLTNLNVYHGSNGTKTFAWSASINTWYHILLVRDGSANLKAYIDGVQIGSTQTSCNANISTSVGVYLGINSALTANYTYMWMKELRISNIARTVAVPTSQYTSDSNTKLLLHFDTPAESPIAPAIYFDGTGDYLQLADSADWDFGTGDFTVECFFWMTSSSSGQNFIARNDGSDWSIRYSGGGALVAAIGGGDRVTYSWTPVLNRWNHIAMVRSGTNVYLFLNGQQVGSTGTDSSNISSANVVQIGASGLGSTLFAGGYIREIRVSNTARYTAAFTPSQSGFTVDSNTKLYIKGNEANGVTTFVDSETTPKTVTTNGNCVIKYTEDYRSCIFKDAGNTGHKPYPVSSAKVDFFALGTGVGYFDGTNSYLSVPDSADWDFGTGNFTIEFYLRLKATSSSQCMVSRNENNDYAVRINASSAFSFDINGSAVVTAAHPFVVSTWYHIMAVRSGSNCYLFVNGTQFSTTGSDSTNLDSSSIIAIGALSSSLSHWLNGRMDNIRIAKGVARYTATFDPPFEPSAVGSSGNFFLLF